MEHLLKTWEDFLEQFVRKNLGDSWSQELLLHPDIAEEAIGQALRELKQFSAFHLPKPDQNPDRHKWAGFVSKWIAKLRPVQYPGIPSKGVAWPAESDQCDIIVRINAYFAMHVFRSFISSPIPQALKRELIYIFHYREEKGETLAILAYASEKVA